MKKRTIKILILKSLLLSIVLYFLKNSISWYYEASETGGKEMGSIAKAMIFYLNVIMLCFFTYGFYLFEKKYTNQLSIDQKEKVKKYIIPTTIIFIIIFILFSFLISYFEKYSDKSISVKNAIAARKHIKSEFKNYKEIYDLAKDSVDKWVHDSVKLAATFVFNPYQIDSLFIFNNDGTSFYSHIFSSYPGGQGIQYFYGANVSGRWCFCLGGSCGGLSKSYFTNNKYDRNNFENVSIRAYTMIGDLYKELSSKSEQQVLNANQNEYAIDQNCFNRIPKNEKQRDSLWIDHLLKFQERKINSDDIRHFNESELSESTIEPKHTKNDLKYIKTFNEIVKEVKEKS